MELCRFLQGSFLLPVDKLWIVFHRLWIGAHGAAQNEREKKRAREKKKREKTKRKKEKEKKKKIRSKRKRNKRKVKEREQRKERERKRERAPAGAPVRVRARGKHQKVKKVVIQMTEQQERFCKIYVNYNCDRGKRADAYIEAGFKTQTRKAASNCAGRLLEKDVIKQKIQQLQEEKFEALRERIENEEERKIMGIIEKRALLAELMNDPYISTQDRLRALDIDNKMEGLYIVKNQITGADGGPVSVNWEVAENGTSYKADNDSI